MKSSHSNIPHSVESIAVTEFFEDYGEQLQLRLVTSKKSLSRSTIRERSVNRPALAVTGYFKYFAHKRIQLFGAGEMGFFESSQKFVERMLFPPWQERRFPALWLPETWPRPLKWLRFWSNTACPYFAHR